MIAALTLTIGWWMVPTAITVIVFCWAYQVERESSGSLLSGICYAIAIVPALLAWCLYLAARLILQ